MPATPVLLDALTVWMSSQRWFAGGRRRPTLTLAARVSLHSDADSRVDILIVCDVGGALPVTYQVPIVLHRECREHSDEGFIAAVDDGGGHPWFAYDGPTDPEFTARLLHLLCDGGQFGDEHARVFSQEGAQLEFDIVESTVLRGEQSNTSIVFSSAPDAPRVICKLFRTLQSGENPDVELQTALSGAGSSSVPAIVGSLTGEWPDISAPSGVARGHLAFAQQFVVGAEDGWQLALDAASAGENFTVDARRMGHATADVHATLASILPTRAAKEEDVATAVFAWQRRLDSAVAEVPELESVRSEIEALYSRAEATEWPPLQRVHGDLHLGQLLRTPEGVWTIIDFEGEPMRALGERSALDFALRDIAGMLRSVDYVAGSQSGTDGAVEWALACRTAFLDGYSERSGIEVRLNTDLLDAFEIDKGLYEVVYEARNRPAWLPIPVAAVMRLARRTENGATRDR